MPVVGSCQDAVLWVWLFDMRLFYIPEPPPVTMALLPVNSRAMLAQNGTDSFGWCSCFFSSGSSVLQQIGENTEGKMGLSTYEKLPGEPVFLISVFRSDDASGI